MLWSYSQAQDVDTTNAYKWKKVASFPVDSGGIWHVDQLNNVFVTRSGSVIKYDSVGVEKFKQSVKSYGNLKQIVSINSMKFIYFSAEQQTLCFLDNTLTPTEDCVDLVDYEIYNAEWIAASSRSEFVWVYDNDNSTLKLISLVNNTELQQEIVNLKGIFGIESVDQILEEGSNLYVVERGNKVFVLDFYGGLIDAYEEENVLMVDRDRSQETVMYYLSENYFRMTERPKDDIAGSTVRIDLPKENVTEFKVVGNYIYLRTPKNVHKYILYLNN